MNFFTDDLLEKLPEFAQQLPFPVELYHEKPKLIADMLGSWLVKVNKVENTHTLLDKACECINQNFSATNDVSAQQPLIEAMFFPLDYATLCNVRGRLDDRLMKIGREFLKSVDGDSFKNF